MGADDQPHVLELQVDLLQRPLEVARSSRARACRCRRARSRRRRPAPRRCSAARPATAAAGAAARRPAARARRGPSSRLRVGLGMDSRTLGVGEMRRPTSPREVRHGDADAADTGGDRAGRHGLLRRARAPATRRAAHVVRRRRIADDQRHPRATGRARPSRVLRRASSPRCPTSASRSSTSSPRTTRPPSAGARRARSRARAPSRASSPTGAARHPRRRLRRGERRQDRPHRRLRRQRGDRAASSARCRRRARRPSSADGAARSTRAPAVARAHGPQRAGADRRRRLDRPRRLPAKTMNVYFVRDGDGVLMFDAGVKQMASGASRPPARRSAASRGSCSATGTPTTAARRRRSACPCYCHPDEVAGRRGRRRLALLRPSTLAWLPPRASCYQLLHAAVLGRRPGADRRHREEGDDVAGFEVVHIPGHAPGLIALWRASDRLALTSDCFYTRRPADRQPRQAARPARGVQPGHRAGARVDPQARGARARRRLAGPREPADRRRARAARARPPPA